MKDRYRRRQDLAQLGPPDRHSTRVALSGSSRGRPTTDRVCSIFMIPPLHRFRDAHAFVGSTPRPLRSRHALYTTSPVKNVVVGAPCPGHAYVSSLFRMRGIIRASLQRVIASAPVGRVLRSLAPQSATVLTYHRFAPAESHDGSTTSAQALRATLAYLRRNGYRLVPLRDILRESTETRGRLAGKVAITVDDGYADFGEVAQPIFAEFDCPATVFVSTGPVDGTCWYWWDRVHLAVARTRATSVHLELDDVSLVGAWPDTSSARRGQGDVFCEALKRVRSASRDTVIDELLTALDVRLPARPPSEFSAMSWDEIRRCERGGITIGAHTVTHPILAQCDDAQAEWEITEGLRRLRAECANGVDLFAYPNGTPSDFGDREVALLEASGVKWAFTTSAGYVRACALGGDTRAARYRVPRFADPGPLSRVARIASGRAQVSAPPGATGERTVSSK